ncbi:hypothetical protein [Haloarcula laminariae]|uniref:hypothetical protein n=1 Tax=Haloarcula laminariae TaxID=2961577 RepID=UPI00240631C7|nr:hypothetical protein [Halomicroarcula sp. FL173]
MSQKISGYVDDELDDLIEAMSDHHGISRSRVIELLLREGANARETRLRIVQLEAKLDLIVESFAEQDAAKDKVREQMTELIDLPTPDGTTGTDLVEAPVPEFQSLGIRPDEWDTSTDTRHSDDQD